ncbi:serine/threonine protein phosphatase [Shewanella sp. JM162201]|uniref:Serine/threonine protein phosphatase n=2 Tax=Shewanella jiangmenensis TaxID=2837387 RepID=A0ABS5UYB7_9GAMM|nr:serine/threonine protein phosphatase [Shewanella jiangmenensis]
MAAFQARVYGLLAEHPGQRVMSFEFDGNKYWLKQPERLEGAMKLLKDEPQSALEHEIAALSKLGEHNAPVPRIILAEPHYFVVEDAGLTVSDWLYEAKSGEDVPVKTILCDSASALAKLHTQNLAHGRPALRDIGWRGGEVKFIDFEANQAGKSMLTQQIRDLLVYLHSLYRYVGVQHDCIQAAIDSYRRSGGEATWQAAKAKLESWQWLRWVLKPFRRVGGKDLKPLYWVLWHFKSYP